MGWNLPPDVERRCLELAAQAGYTPTAPPHVFKDEADFMAAVIAEAKALDWLHYHTYDSRKCEDGFPDLILVRPPRQIAAECKRSKKEKLTPKQKKWLTAFQGVPGVTVRVWSPEDWDDIMQQLQGEL